MIYRLVANAVEDWDRQVGMATSILVILNSVEHTACSIFAFYSVGQDGLQTMFGIGPLYNYSSIFDFGF